MKKLALILTLLMGSFMSKAGSGSCTLYSSADGSAQCSSSDYYNVSDTWYVTNSSRYISLHGWGTVYPDDYPEYNNNYVFLEAAWYTYLGPVTGEHFDITYDSPSSDRQSYGYQVDMYCTRDSMAYETSLYLCSRTSDGANGGIYASW